jgi:hypothetical protein
MSQLLLHQNRAHALSVIEFTQCIRALGAVAHPPGRLRRHLGFGDQIADGRIPSRKDDPRLLADDAAPAITADQVLRAQRAAVGQQHLHARVVLLEVRDFDASLNRHVQLSGPIRERAFDVLLPEAEPVVVA